MTECGFTLKRVRYMTRTYGQYKYFLFVSSRLWKEMNLRIKILVNKKQQNEKQQKPTTDVDVKIETQTEIES